MAGPDGTGQPGSALPDCSAAPCPRDDAPPPSPPAAFVCPISLTLMSDPVLVVPTGQTYERSSIESWLASHSTCPTTGQRLQRPVPLVPVFALRSAIEEWARKHAPQLLDLEGHVQPAEDCPGTLTGSSLPGNSSPSSSGNGSSSAATAAGTPHAGQRSGGARPGPAGSGLGGAQACVSTAPASAAGFYYPTAVGTLLLPSAGSGREGSSRGGTRTAMPRITAAPLLAPPSVSRGVRRAASSRMARREEGFGLASSSDAATSGSSGWQGRAPRITAAPLLVLPPHTPSSPAVSSTPSAAAQRRQQQQQQSRASGSGSSGGSSRPSYVLPPAHLYRPRSAGANRDLGVPVPQPAPSPPAQLQPPQGPSFAAGPASPPAPSASPEDIRTPSRLSEGAQRAERPAILYPAPLLVPRQLKQPGRGSGGVPGAATMRAAAPVHSFPNGRGLPVIVGAPLVPGQAARKKGGCAIQ